MVNNIVTTLYGDDGNWTYCGDYFIMCKNIESLCGTPETNTVLYVKYNLIKKNLMEFALLSDLLET